MTLRDELEQAIRGTRPAFYCDLTEAHADAILPIIERHIAAEKRGLRARLVELVDEVYGLQREGFSNSGYNALLYGKWLMLQQLIEELDRDEKGSEPPARISGEGAAAQTAKASADPSPVTPTIAERQALLVEATELESATWLLGGALKIEGKDLTFKWYKPEAPSDQVPGENQPIDSALSGSVLEDAFEPRASSTIAERVLAEIDTYIHISKARPMSAQVLRSRIAEILQSEPQQEELIGVSIVDKGIRGKSVDVITRQELIDALRQTEFGKEPHNPPCLGALADRLAEGGE